MKKSFSEPKVKTNVRRKIKVLEATAILFLDIVVRRNKPPSGYPVN